MTSELRHKNLFIQVKCSICFGTKDYYNGKKCPYCDKGGLHFVEATFKEVCLRLQMQNISKEDKLYLINILQLDCLSEKDSEKK